MNRLWQYNYFVEPARGRPSDLVSGWSVAVGETYRKRIGELSLHRFEVSCHPLDCFQYIGGEHRGRVGLPHRRVL